MPRGSARSNGSPDLRPLLIHYIRSLGGDATIGSLLADPVVGPFVRGLTIAQLQGGTPARAAAAPAKRGRAAKGGVRTAGGRETYDAKVLAAIKAARGPAGAEALIKATGGTSQQFRQATKRLVAARKVKRTGKARGTRYVAL